jgi:hypothetical protein
VTLRDGTVAKLSGTIPSPAVGSVIRGHATGVNGTHAGTDLSERETIAHQNWL